MNPADKEKLVEVHFEQYKLLKSEIDNRVAEATNLELYAVGALAGLGAWVLKDAPTASGYAVWVGPFIPFFGFLRWKALIKRIEVLAAYQRELELIVFAGGDPHKVSGWETFLAIHLNEPRPKKQKEKWRLELKQTGELFWWLLIALSWVLVIIVLLF